MFRSKAKPGDTIGVIGLGAIGLLLTHVALKLGYRVIVTELMEEKLNRALTMGAVFAEGGKTPKETSVKLEILYQKEGVTSVFECAGSSQSATMAIEAAPRGAEIILLGLSTEPAYFNPRLISRKGNNIVPSLIYDHPFDFQRCIQLIERGIIHPGFVVSKYFSVKNLTEALQEAVKGKESKIVVQTEG